MKHLILGCCVVAMMTGLSGCTNFKATDKLMSNEHRIIQNTRIHQQPKQIVQTAAVQAPLTYTPQATIAPTTIVVEPEIQTARRQVTIVQPTTTVARTIIQPVAQEIRVQTLTRANLLVLQNSLKARGLYSVPVDGVFGMHTARGLASYQKQMGETGPVTVQLLQGLGVFLNS